MNDLDDIPSTSAKPKDITIKTLKKESNKYVLKAMEKLAGFLDKEGVKDTVLLAASQAMIKLHIGIMDKEIQYEIWEQQKRANHLRILRLTDPDPIVGENQNKRNENDGTGTTPPENDLDIGLDFTGGKVLH